MDETVNEVEAIKKRFNKFEVNFKKCSQKNRTKGYLEGRLSGLDEIWQHVCDADEKMESFKDDNNKEDEYFENDQFGQMEEKYYQLKGELKDLLDAFQPQQQQQPNANHNGNHNPNEASKESKVKLPKIELPTFSGSYHTWISFKNRFTNLIHDNKSLSNVDKLEYLKSCTTHEAEKAIQRFQITDQNYKAAWDRLNEKYDSKRMLQDTEIETIIDRKEIKAETAKEIRELLDVVQESLETLKNMNVDTTSWDPMLVVLVKRKLPFKTREEWEKQLEPEQVPTYAELIAFLEKRFRTVESLELVGGNSTDADKRNPTNNINKIKSNHRASCPACYDAFHSLMKCEIFLKMSVSNRSAFVNAKSLCRNCLATGHMIKDCNSTKTCFKCNRSHHTLLHRDDVGKISSQEPSYSSNSFVTRGQSSQNPNHNPNYSANYNPISNPNGQLFTNSSSNRSNRTQFYPMNSNSGAQAQFVQRNQQINQNPLNVAAQNFQPSQSIHNPVSNQVKRNLTTIAESKNGIISRESDRETLFPTAIIKFRSKGGITYNLRALLDQCSEDVFIKEPVAKMLGGVQFGISSFDVTGLNGVVTSRVEKATNVQMVIESEVFDMNANIVKTLVGVLPKTIVKWPRELFKNLKLADSNFATPNNVDIMLGTKAYSQILLDGVVKEGGYLAQNTKVGWIISGKGEDSAMTANSKRMLLCIHTENEERSDDILRKFWEMEEAPRRKKKLTNEEVKCEEIFKGSYRRLSDGRPQVKLPFKEDPSESLGESRNQAVARWLAMERKFEKDKNLKEDYMKAIREHLDLGHMERISTSEKEHKIIRKDGSVRYSCYYIPHHAVIREESKTTKTRIVFDASAKSNSGKSLNEILMVGPTIQESLIVRLMKWRIHRFALRGDITKMYRQVKVYDEDVNFQRMVFRFDRTDPIEDFGLNTLTFGTASAPYNAMRTLKQLAIDSGSKYPVGSKVVKTDFHVDDLLTGADTVEKVGIIWKEVRGLLMEAKFPMRKWSEQQQ